MNIYRNRTLINSCSKLIILCCVLLIGCAASNTSLTNAAFRGDMITMRSLINSGANVNEMESQPLPFLKSVPPIHAAIEAGKIEAVKLLLDSGANPNIREKYGYTPLFIASNQPVIIKMLIEKGADINAKSDYNETPLIFAAQSDNIESVKILIENGSNVEIRDNHGRNALNYAKDNQNTEIIALLSKQINNPDEANLDYSQFQTRDRSIDFNHIRVKLNYSAEKTIAIVVQDKRPYVASGKTDPSYVGIFRRNLGIPWSVTTVDKVPFSKVIESCVATSFKDAGFKIITLTVEPSESIESVSDKIQKSGAKKAILIELSEWQCDTYYRAGLIYDARIAVIDENKKIIASHSIRGEDSLSFAHDSDPEFSAKLRVPEFTKINLSKLLNSPDVQRGLTEQTIK